MSSSTTVGPAAHSPLHRHLHVPADTSVHRLAPEAKLVGLVAFATTTALAPRREVAVFAAAAVVLVAVVRVSRLAARMVAVRLLVVVPFVVVAALVPFVAGGDRVDVAGVPLSVEGLWASWNIAAKAVLGATAAIVVSATTPVPDLLHGMRRLRVPTAFVAIAGFMVRYLDVLVDRLARMRLAMAARGHDPRWLWQLRPLAASVGTLFVRSYEHGERIHLAMVARGFTGEMPALEDRRARWSEWTTALVPATLVGAVLTGAMLR